MRPAEDCPFRHDVRRQQLSETAACSVLTRTFGSAAERLVRVERDVCNACCAACEPEHWSRNPILASIVYHRAHMQLEEQPASSDASHFRRLKEEARLRLPYAANFVKHEPNALCLPGAGERPFHRSTPEPRPGRVGLIGWNTPTGLGYLNRDIATHLPVERWLAPLHPRLASLSGPRMSGEYCSLENEAVQTSQLHAWLSGLDWLLFAERPYLDGVVQQARRMGIHVACVPMWEWLSVGLDWLRYVDLMLCPTRSTFCMLQQWRKDLGFAWEVVYTPWSIDPQQFTYRCRERCNKFLFVNGTGGVRARRADGSATNYRRKGIEIIAATARLMKSIPFLVYSESSDLPAMPGNVEIRQGPVDNFDLYAEGDVCILPSHWEGIGLQLLECQAAGLPLVTTDAPPMNECQPFRPVPVSETELVLLSSDQPVDSHRVHPEVLADVLHGIHGSDLREASRQARLYVEQERSWQRLRETLAALLTA